MLRRLFKGGGNTQVDEGPFQMILPGRWERIVAEPEQRWNYLTEREQITVSVMGTDHELNDTEQREVLAKYVDVRRQAESSDGAKIEMSEVVSAQLGSVHVARYEGLEPSSSRWFTCMIMLAPNILVTAYYEALEMKYVEFTKRGRSAFNSITIR